MGLLPCLRRGSLRWWLPLSDRATDAIGHVMLAVGRGGEVDTATRVRLQRALCADPPLMIFAALGASAPNLSTEGQAVSTGRLSEWLIRHLTGCFASGDAFLGAPPIYPAHRLRWQRLRDHYATLPIEHWLEDAALWLEVTGPRVPAAWREQWPREIVDDLRLDVSDAHAGTSLLQPLARMMQRQRTLQQTFDEQLRRSKLGALKQLAYGLSHEINNPLANISTRAQQLQRTEADETRLAILQRIIDQVYRAHEMIADLMFYAYPPQGEFAPSDLNHVVREVVGGFQAEAKRQAIRLEIESESEVAQSNCDAKMIAEAVRAVVRNAIEAIGCEGTIVVSLVRQDGRWLIHVADSGPGLTEAARRHAFDPYFSGREAGRGLGLGLCRAYRIAKLHHGDVQLAGGPIGCVVTIAIPDERRIVR